MESDSGRGKDSIDSKSLICSIDWYIVARVKFRREAYFIILVPAGLVCAAPNPVIPKWRVSRLGKRIGKVHIFPWCGNPAHFNVLRLSHPRKRSRNSGKGSHVKLKLLKAGQHSFMRLIVFLYGSRDTARKSISLIWGPKNRKINSWSPNRTPGIGHCKIRSRGKRGRVGVCKRASKTSWSMVYDALGWPRTSHRNRLILHEYL